MEVVKVVALFIRFKKKLKRKKALTDFPQDHFHQEPFPTRSND